MVARTPLLALLSLLIAACATTTGPFNYRNGILTDATGHTLYTYSKDTKGNSNCGGACAQRWPPYLAAADDPGGGFFTVITRDDGRRQWTYNGQPLYFNATDYLPGDRKGGGVDGAWSVVRSPILVEPPRGNDGGY